MRLLGTGAAVLALLAASMVVTEGTVARPAMATTAAPPTAATTTSYPIPGDALFVAPTGNDANAGTQAAPLRTAGAAVAKASAGKMTTIVLRAGEYRERLGYVAVPVTLQPYPGEQVWFKGSSVIQPGQWIADGGAWRLDNWNPGSVCRASAPAYDECMNPLHFNDDNPVGGDPQMVFVDGEPLRQVATREEVRAGTFFHDGTADKTYIGADPAGRRVEVTAIKSGMHFFAGADGSIVRGLGFAHYGSSQNQTKEPAAVIAQAKDMVFENNTIIHNAATGLLVNADNIRVNRNAITDNGYLGIQAHRSANLTVEGNRVSRNNTERLGYSAGYNLSGAGMFATRVHNAVVRDNVFEANQGNGLWCDLSCHKLTAVRNLIRGNSRHGLHYKVSGEALLASNVLAGNGVTGLSVLGSNKVRIINNTSVGNGQAIAVQEDSRPTCPGDDDDCPTDAERALGITWDTADTTLMNNVIAADAGTAPLVNTTDNNTAESGRRVGGDGMIPVAQMHHNGYSRELAGTPGTLVQWSRVTGASLHFPSLAEFQAATGRDAGSRYQESSFLVNAPAGDYRLLPGSPAETAGAALPADVAAAIGVPATGQVRLGALAWPGEPLAAEHLRNGSADGASTVPWWTTGAQLAAVDGELRASVADGTAEAVLAQRTAPLVSGRTYTLSFDARASADVAVQVAVQEGDAPYNAALAQDVELEAAAQRFSFPFTATTDTTVAEVAFQLGGKGALTVHLDNVSLVENTWGVSKEPKATEAEALAAAAATGRLVEVLAERGETREVYATPDGSFTSKEHFQPVRVFKDGVWVPLDTTLRKQPDGSIVPGAVPTSLKLSGGGGGPLVTINRAGRPMALTWPTTLPTPWLDGDTAVYPRVLPDVDLRVRAEPEGFSHVLVVKTAQAAKDPRLATIKLGLSAPGLTVRAAEDGTQEAVDEATGAVVYEAPVPIMWDSTPPAAQAMKALGSPETDQPDGNVGADASATQPGDTSKIAAVATTVANGEMTLTPDASLLTGSDTTYPVYIDPMWDTPRASARLMVSSAGWAKYNFTKTEGMGRCPRDYPPSGRYCNGWYEKRLFYRVPTAKFAHKQIISAEFHAEETFATSCRKRIVDIHLATAFGAGSTWNSTKDNWGRRLDSRNVAKGWSSGCPAGDVLFNVTSAMRQAAKEGWSSTTFGLRARDGDDQLAWKRFERNAFVRVHYNSPPPQPKMSQLSSSPGGPCRGPQTPATFNRLPTLFAKNLTDPDNKGVEGEKLKAQFQVKWYAGGVLKTKNLGTVKKMSASGPRRATFSVKVPAGVVPQGTTAHWEVRAYDGRAWSPWSSAGNATACYFLYDARALPEPVITSTAYPPLDPANPGQTPTDGVGKYGAFAITMDARVAKYAWAMNTDPSEGSAKTKTAATESVTAMPTHAGLNTLYVTAWDAANNWSTGTYEFWVAEGKAPKAHWKMDEAAGATQLADSAGAYPATPLGGAQLGVTGALGKAINLNGTGAYAATSGPVLNTAQNLAVSAWVKLPATLPTTHLIVASQAGTKMAGFSLKYDPGDKKWRFFRTQADGSTVGAGTAVSANPARPGVWTHLVGVQDVVAKKLRIYVNGVEGVAAGLGPVWAAGNAFQIGAGLWNGQLGYFVPGRIDDVRAFDRIVTADEVHDLFTIKPVVESKWHLNSATGSPATSPDTGQGVPYPLTLNGAAKITTDWSKVLVQSPAGTPSGALELPGGNNDYASAGGAVIDTRDSFTVSAWVSTPGTPGRVMTVLGLAGSYNSAIAVRYDPAKKRYVVDVPSKDGTGATTATVEHSTFHQGNYGDWDHLALTFDATEGTVTLWVNGNKEAAAGGNLSFRHGTRPFGPIASLQVGRSLAGGGYPAGRAWAGVIDDVWVLRGVASQDLINQLSLPTELGAIPG
ncbi:LamG-like jellyroll fold domain-containing protein [Nonomuraea endophytica]|uniref:Parallel beta-helix repeat protein n=1 Tax=Nonomuraea endophytica TaxID=714136 RepID=A0A7W8EGQ4_9ACTN|nr:LamG-like jellyroll fold domain-containing protein [Nonomuraea endophytica]MBB5078834.1 parallel beta-helix repeat protein [Nonomuraea endophytica]